MFKKTLLPSGLRVMTAPMQGTNTVTTLVIVGTGSDYETREDNGISHFLEHMFFKGTKKRPRAMTIKNELDSIGGVSNAFTTHEFTGYWIKAGKTFLDLSLDLLSDIYRNSLLKQEEIDREKQVVMEEMHQYNDTPTRSIWDLWEEVLWGDQPAGWKILGREDVLRKLKRDDFVNYFYNQYSAQNTIVVVAGNFDEGATVEKIKHYFAGVRDAAPIRQKPAVHFDQKQPVARVHYKKTDQTHISLGFRAYEAGHPDRYVIDVLATLLGGNWSSRMWDVVRDKLGLAYTVWTNSDADSNRGTFTTYAGVDHKNATKAIGAMMREYKRIAEKPVSAKELKLAVDSIKGKTLIGLEASDAVADFVGIEEIITGSPLTVDEVFRNIEKVTPADVSRVARKLFVPSALNLAVVGPYKDAKPFEGLLKL
ncbi:MAG: hypothetical protein A3I44_02740 [Candidatus Sungbacteria bacterium RIFCSPLOWO2_02_FULL_51_17]|nr:MAG: hypothetical protein A3I44_02740 [Candidatus Sungbacteria bacterium RIFCSPLOWO2_02_FULL_51_17]